MLKTSKIPLENNIYKLLVDAYISQHIQEIEARQCNNIAQAEIQKAAIKFAEKAAGPTASAIYNFIKEIGITITVPPTVIAPSMPPSLPGGPCTGVISTQNISIL